MRAKYERMGGGGGGGSPCVWPDIRAGGGGRSPCVWPDIRAGGGPLAFGQIYGGGEVPCVWPHTSGVKAFATGYIFTLRTYLKKKKKKFRANPCR